MFLPCKFFFPVFLPFFLVIFSPGNQQLPRTNYASKLGSTGEYPRLDWSVWWALVRSLFRLSQNVQENQKIALETP